MERHLNTFSQISKIKNATLVLFSMTDSNPLESSILGRSSSTIRFIYVKLLWTSLRVKMWSLQFTLFQNFIKVKPLI